MYRQGHAAASPPTSFEPEVVGPQPVCSRGRHGDGESPHHLLLLLPPGGAAALAHFIPCVLAEGAFSDLA
jgi:hypothetical protein